MRIISCCKGCQRRKVGCHSSCEEYIKEKAAAEDNRKKMIVAKEFDAYCSCKGKRRVI